MENRDLILPEEYMNRIHVIRGQKVMLDSDLAELYEVPTKRINEQVRRNPERFPEDFIFELTNQEYDNLKSQSATSSWGGRRKLPLVFTEHGILMLSSVLSSEKAIAVNINIMRIFTMMRQLAWETQDLRSAIEELRKKCDQNGEEISSLFGYLEAYIQSLNPDYRTPIGFRQQFPN